MTTPDTATLNRTDRLTIAQQATGEQNIRRVDLQLSILRQNGILVDMNIQGTNLFKKALTWLESGINLDGDDDRLNYFTKGQKYVWNEAQVKELNSVITQMRQLLARSTYNVTGFFPYRYMPFTYHARFVTRWAELSDRFYAIKNDMIANRDRVVDQLATQYAEIAENIFKALTSKNHSKYIVVTYRDGNSRTMDKVEWVSFMVENTVRSIPSAELIDERLHATYVTGLLYTDRDNVLDGATFNRAHQDMLANNNNDPRISEMMRHEAERMTRTPQVTSPFMEVFSALRLEIAEDAQEILESIGRNKFVHGKVAERARGLLEAFDLKAAHNDDELRNLLVSLKEEAKAADDTTRNVDRIEIILNAIISLKPNDMKANAFSAIEID